MGGDGGRGGAREEKSTVATSQQIVREKVYLQLLGSYLKSVRRVARASSVDHTHTHTTPKDRLGIYLITTYLKL